MTSLSNHSKDVRHLITQVGQDTGACVLEYQPLLDLVESLEEFKKIYLK